MTIRPLRLGSPLLAGLLLTACGNPLPSGVLVELLPKLTVTTDTPQVPEGQPAKFVIHLSEPSARPVTVRFYTQPGTASSTPDYDGQDTPFSPTERVFNPGQTELPVEINTTQDNVFEADETFRFYLHSGDGADVDTALQYYVEVTILDDDPPPTLDLADTVPDSQTRVETDGTVDLSFVINKDAEQPFNTPGVDITVPIRYEGTAVRGEDFQGPDQVVLKKNQSLDDFTVPLSLIDDIQSGEPDKTIEVILDPPDNAVLGTRVRATITLQDDDASGRLNDTGVTTCQDDLATLPCPAASHPGQDGDRDTPMRFSLYAVGTDECIVDENTGLMWERKQADDQIDGKRRAVATYTWYETAENRNGGDAGSNTAGGTTAGACGLDNCTTSAYIARVNQDGLCGFHDWRLPKLHELLTLVRYDEPACLETRFDGTCLARAAIDPTAFPHTKDWRYWTATPSAYRPTYAWAVTFGNSNAPSEVGTFSTRAKSEELHIRAVRRVRPGDLP